MDKSGNTSVLADCPNSLCHLLHPPRSAAADDHGEVRVEKDVEEGHDVAFEEEHGVQSCVEG